MTQRNSTYPDIAKEAMQKAYEKLANATADDFCTEAMALLLQNISNLEYLAKEWEELPYRVFENPTEPKPEIQQTAAPVSDAKSDAVSDETSAPAHEPEVTKMSDQELRGYFTAARKKGLNVSAFIKELGAGNLTELTAQQRITAVEKLKAGGYV